MAGTDLSDNYNLSLESLEQLRDYREAGLRDAVLESRGAILTS
jgi:hypothetical protein